MKKLLQLSKTAKRQADQFSRLIYPHTTALYQSAFKLTGSKADAEDIVQDILIKLYPKTHELQNITELRPWLFRVLYNQFIDHCRKQKRNPVSAQNREQLAGGETVGLLSSHNDSPDVLYGKNRQSDHVLAVLQGLPQDRRALIVLHLIDGFTLDELTTILDIPLGTLKSRLHRTKLELKRLLAVEPFHVGKRERDIG